MVIRSRILAFGYRAAAALVIVIGIARVSGLWTATPSWSAFLYYTVLSNVMCLGWMILSALITLRDAQRDGWSGTSSPSPRWAAAVMQAITVTMLIYLFVLAPALFTQPGAYEPFTLTDNLVHIITPILVIVDWALFVPKGHLRRYDPLLWALIPFAYLVFAYTYSAVGGRFAGGTTVPYPFMDVARHGVGGVAAWIVGLTVGLVAVGYLFVGCDRLLARAVTSPRASRGLHPTDDPAPER